MPRKKRKSRDTRTSVNLKCLCCGRVFAGSLLDDVEDVFERIKSPYLKQHIGRNYNRNSCWQHYKDANLVKENKINLTTSIVASPQEVGLRQPVPQFSFNRSVNYQTIPVPVQNIDPGLLDSITHNEGNYLESDAVNYLETNAEEENDHFMVLDTSDEESLGAEEDHSVSGNDHNKEEHERRYQRTIPPPSTIDINAPMFRSDYKPFPRLAVEVELFNIITKHQMSFAAYKSIFEWAIRSEQRSGFSFATTQSRPREQILKEVKSFLTDEPEEFHPRIVHQWLPQRKPVEVYVKDFRVALNALLKNTSLMEESNLSFPDPDVPFIWNDFPDPSKKKNTVISELHHGTWWVKSWKERLRPPERNLCGDCTAIHNILVPVIFYMDGVALDNHGRLKMTPLNFTLGIFSVEARKRADAWQTIYYHPDPEVIRIAHNTTKVEPVEQQQNLHSGLEVALQSFYDLCQKDEGIVVKGLRYGGKSWTVRCQFAIAYVIGDTKEHDQLCGCYGNWHSVKYPCRHCQICQEFVVDSERSFNAKLWQPKDFKLTREHNIKYFQKYSHHRIRNEFHRHDFGSNYRNIHLATPSELLHLHQLGTAKRVVESFGHMIDNKIGKQLRRNDRQKRNIIAFQHLCLLSQNYGILLNRQSDRDRPLTRFTSVEILKPKMKEGKHYAGILLCLLLCLLSPLGQKYVTDDALQQIERVSEFVEVIELVLGMEEFLKQGGLCSDELGQLWSMIDVFIEKITQTCRRNDNENEGYGTRLIKYHMYFHLPQHIYLFGPPSGWDSSFQESSHKTELKAPSKNTQRRPTLLIEQTAMRQSEVHLLQSAAKQLFSSTRSESSTSNTSLPKCKAMSGPHYHVSMGDDGRPRMEWKHSRDKRSLRGVFLPQEVLDFCVKKVLPKVDDEELVGFTEHQRYNEGDNLVYKFRAHPSYHSKNKLRCSPWYDWALVNIDGSGTPHPCHIGCFLQIRKPKPDTQYIYDYPIDTKPDELYAVVRRFVSTPRSFKVGPPRQQYEPKLVKQGVLEKRYILVHCDTIMDEAIVVPKIKELNKDGDRHFVYDHPFFVVENRASWCRFFLDSIRKQKDKLVVADT